MQKRFEAKHWATALGMLMTFWYFNLSASIVLDSVLNSNVPKWIEFVLLHSLFAPFLPIVFGIAIRFLDADEQKDYSSFNNIRRLVLLYPVLSLILVWILIVANGGVSISVSK